MDNADKMEDWQMWRAGRKWVARSRTREEEDNVRMTRVRRVPVSGACREGERAGQIWATVTLGRWLRALSSVYITLTDQAKTATRQKWSLLHDVHLQVNTSCQSISAQSVNTCSPSTCNELLQLFICWDSLNVRITLHMSQLTGSN